MSIENRFSRTERQEDLDNLQTVTHILESGNDGEVERLRRHIELRKGRAVPTQEIQRYREFAQQRRRLIDQSSVDTKKRIDHEPQATDLEYAVGTYHESLEPPVRNAVFSLRQKGYSSFESGFAGFEKQQITFELLVQELAAHIFSDSVMEACRKTDVKPFCKENAVGFRMHRPLSDTELTELWELLADDLPKLAIAQPVTHVRTAIHFRQQQELHFRKT